MTITRPVLRYHGGKFRLAPWVIEHFPAHQTYVEPFGGAASVLMLKPRSHGEVYNDLESEVVNVFKVLQDERLAKQLTQRILLTPFAREVFREAYEFPTDQVDRAFKMIVRAYMGFGSASMTRTHITGFRANANRSGTTPADDWASWPYQVREFTERLRGVVIENRPAIKVMQTHDSKVTLHYVDPPYLPETRTSLAHKNGNRGHFYVHDMEAKDHEELAECLHSLKGMVVLSGYDSPLYRKLYKDWVIDQTQTNADGARARTETIWMNPSCARQQTQRSLFA